MTDGMDATHSMVSHRAATTLGPRLSCLCAQGQIDYSLNKAYEIPRDLQSTRPAGLHASSPYTKCTRSAVFCIPVCPGWPLQMLP